MIPCETVQLTMPVDESEWHHMVHHRCYVLPSFVPDVSHEHVQVSMLLSRKDSSSFALGMWPWSPSSCAPSITRLKFFSMLTVYFANRLSWADTAASTIGRLWGRYTPPLPRRIPYTGISYAPRKSTGEFRPILSVLITALADHHL